MTALFRYTPVLSRRDLNMGPLLEGWEKCCSLYRYGRPHYASHNVKSGECHISSITFESSFVDRKVKEVRLAVGGSAVHNSGCV
jgi:hypothetical protein